MSKRFYNMDIEVTKIDGKFYALVTSGQYSDVDEGVGGVVSAALLDLASKIAQQERASDES